MSQPPSQDPWSPFEPPVQPPPGAPVPTPAFAVPAQPLQYVVPQYGRPGLITAIGVISIIIASLSIIWSLVTVLQAAGYYIMSVMSATVAASQAQVAAANAAPPVVLPPPGSVDGGGMPAVGPRGMTPDERGPVVRDLAQRQPLLPSRKRQLDAILAAAGKELGTDHVSESGTMPALKSGETPEYFVTKAGRLELFNDRAVFYPNNGTQTIRASAPVAAPPGAPAPPVPPASPAPSGAVEPALEVEDSVVVTAGAMPATSPSTGPAPPVPLPGALSPAEVQTVVQQVQTLSGTPLNPAQVTSLQVLLSAPGQQLVPPGGAQSAVVTAYTQPGGGAGIQFSNGGSVTLGPQGNVTAMTTVPVMPTFSFNPLTLGLMVVTAVASLALAVYLLVCGIMTLRQSPRARRLHLIYSFIKIPLAVTAGVAAAMVSRDLMASIAIGGTPAGASLFSGIVPGVLGCAYPVALLITLNLKQVREYYGLDGGGASGRTAVS